MQEAGTRAWRHFNVANLSFPELLKTEVKYKRFTHQGDKETVIIITGEKYVFFFHSAHCHEKKPSILDIP